MILHFATETTNEDIRDMATATINKGMPFLATTTTYEDFSIIQ